MGTVCGKPSSSAIKDSEDSPKRRELNRKTSELRAISSKRNESFRVKRRYDSGEIRVNLVDKKANSWSRIRDDHYDKEKENSLSGFSDFSGIARVPKALEGEQVAAGWPSWLVEVAGEAIKGWIPRKSETFEKLDKIGQGTYSSVFKAMDLVNNKVVALKRVRFDNMDVESVKFMAREIVILRKLDHPNIIKLEGLVTSRSSGTLYLVFEYMEHDLTGLASLPDAKFTEPQIKCYMKQLLSGLDHCHSRGILHRDIKGSNLLLDNNGILKIADFGLASFFNNNRRIPLTSRVVTLWYRPPELLLGATHYGIGVDLWSTGCILGELFNGQPIMPGKTEVEQMHKIFKLCGSPSEKFWREAKLPHSNSFKPQQPYRRRLADTFRDLPAAALGLLETLLAVDPADRGSAGIALESEFFTTKPYPCDPSSLPKYPPSKEIDAKLRDEEFRRRGAVDVNGRKGEYESRRSKDVHGVPAHSTNAELARSMQRRHERYAPNPSISHKDEDASGVPFDQPRHSQAANKETLEQQHSRKFAHSGPLAPGVGWARSGKKAGEISNASSRANLSTLSGLVAHRPLVSEDSRNKIGSSQLEVSNRIGGRPSASFQEHLRREGQEELGRARSREPVSNRDGWKGNNIHFSGPLLGPANNMEELLKEHDRRIQEVARRARLKKIGVSKVHNQATQVTGAKPVHL